MTHAASVAIRLEHVAKRFGSVDVLRDLSWEVLQGHIVGLLGLNGAGKTTLLRLLLGMLRRSEGSAMVAGVVLDGPSADVRQRVGYVPERSHIPGNFTPDRLEAVGRETFSAWDAEHYDGVLQHFRIGRNKPMFLMSQGQRILTSLAFSLAHHAEILLLDEPTNGLDPLARRDFLTRLIEESYDQGRTVIVSSHRLDEVEHIAQDIAILNRGTLAASGPLDELIARDRVLSLRVEGEISSGNWSRIPGVRSVTQQGQEVLLYVSDFNETAMRDALAHWAVTGWMTRRVSLAEFFEERVKSRAS